MKLLAPVLIFSLIATNALAEGIDQREGPARVTLDKNEIPSCIVHDLIICPAGYDDHGTPSIGDDSAYTYQTVSAASIELQGIGPIPSEEAQVEPAEIFLPHHALDTTDSTVVAAFGWLPEPLRKEFVVYSFPEGTTAYAWGPSLDGNGQAQYPVLVVAIPSSDRNGTHLSNGFYNDTMNTDEWVPNQMTISCAFDSVGLAILCQGAAIHAMQDLWWAETPSIQVGATFNETRLSTAPGELHRQPDLKSVDREGSPSRPMEGVPGHALPDELIAMTHRDVIPDRPSFWESSWPSKSSTGVPAESAVALVGDHPIPPPVILMVLGLLFVPLLWLYFRIVGHKAAKHPTRQRILEHLRDHPGCDIAELARMLDVDYKTAQGHVRTLERNFMVSTKRAGLRIRVALPGDDRRALRAAVLRQPIRRNLALLVHAEPGLRAAEAAERLAVSRSTLHPHVHVLVKAGVIVREGRRLLPAHGAEVWEASVKGLETGSSPALLSG